MAAKTQGGGRTSDGRRLGGIRGPFRARTNFASLAMLVSAGDVDRLSRREGSVKPRKEREVPVYRYETSKSMRSRKSQAPSLEKTQWWMKNPKIPIRNHSKRGWWTLPDTDKIKG